MNLPSFLLKNGTLLTRKNLENEIIRPKVAKYFGSWNRKGSWIRTSKKNMRMETPLSGTVRHYSMQYFFQIQLESILTK